MPPAGCTAGRWSTRSTRCSARRSSATAWAAGWSFRAYRGPGAPGLPPRRGGHRPGRAGQARWSSRRRACRPTASRVIYPGIDLGEYDRPGDPAEIPGVGPEHKVVMYVGSIVHPNQGVPILIDALPRGLRRRARGPLRARRRPGRGRRGLPATARAVRRPPDRADRPNPGAGRRADPPGRRAGPPAARLPRELLGAEQDRRLPRRRPADRRDRLRRLPAILGRHRRRPAHRRSPRSRWPTGSSRS